MQKIIKILRAVTEKTASWTNQPTNANLETFCKYPQVKIFFFQNPALWLFYLYSPLISYKKSEKSLEPFLRKPHYQPTNQSTNYQQHWFYRTWPTRVQQNKVWNDIVLDEFCV